MWLQGCFDKQETHMSVQQCFWVPSQADSTLCESKHMQSAISCPLLSCSSCPLALLQRVPQSVRQLLTMDRSPKCSTLPLLLDKPFVTMFQLHQIAWSTSIISTDLPLACSLADATCAIAVVSNTFDWQTSSTSQPATPMMSQECWKQNWTGNTSSTNDTAFQQLFSSRDAQPLLCLFGRWLCLVSMFQYPVVQVV